MRVLRVGRRISGVCRLRRVLWGRVANPRPRAVLTNVRVELGIANARRKLEALGLAGYVGQRLDSEVGNFHFVCTDVEGLLTRVRDLGWNFEGDRRAHWHLREPVARLSLHIKHFDGWPADKLQVHIDIFGVVGPMTWILHALTARSYRRVERIARTLDERRTSLRP